MFNYENVGFIDRLPDDTINSDSDILNLIKLKNTIDIKLRRLEDKIRANSFSDAIVEEETKTKHIKSAIHFSPMKNPV